MREVITIEKFSELKDQMNKIFLDIKDNYSQLLEEYGDEEKLMQYFLESIEKVQGTILSYDLSSIPFDMWEGTKLFSINGGLDFTGTKANIDCSKIDMYVVGELIARDCNLINIDSIKIEETIILPNNFNETTIKQNPSCFIEYDYPAEFIEKFYKKQVTVKDISTLSDDQIERLTSERLKRCAEDYNSFNRVISRFGLKRIVDIYKLDPFYLNELNTFCLLADEEDFFVEPEDNTLFIDSLHERIFDMLVLGTIYIDPNDISSKLKNKYPDFFFKNLPEDVLQRFYNHNLSYEDIINYSSHFEDVFLDRYYSGESVPFRGIIYKLQVGGIQKVLAVYKTFFDDIIVDKDTLYTVESKLSDFLNILSSKGITDFDAVKVFEKCVINSYINDYLHSLNDDYSDFNMSKLNWAKDLGYSFVPKINSMEEFIKLSDKSIILDKNQRNFFSAFGIENLQRFDKETGFITHYGFDSFMLIVKELDSLGYEWDSFIEKSYVFNYQTFEKMMVDVFKMIREHSGRFYYFEGYDFIDGDFRKNHSEIFIDQDAPSQLTKLFYKGKLSLKTLGQNKEWITWLKGKDICSSLENNDIKFFVRSYVNKTDNDTFLNFIVPFLSCIDVFPMNERVDSSLGKKEMELWFYDLIGKEMLIKFSHYSEDMPDVFKNKFPSLFLPANAPDDLKEKFYGKRLSLKDFINNPNYFDYFENTDILYGFNKDYCWLNKTAFSDGISLISNKKKIQIIAAFEKLNDSVLEDIFIETICSFDKDYDYESDAFKCISDLLVKLSKSNASEMYAFRKELGVQLLYNDNPMEAFARIENIFLKNNIPVVGKLYSVFNILHPNLGKVGDKIRFDNDKMSPVLKSKGITGRNIVLFADLIKASVGSNNRSLKEYLDNIEKGNSLFLSISNGERSYEELADKEKGILKEFVLHLNTLFNNTKRGTKDAANVLSGDIIEDIKYLKTVFSKNGQVDYDLPDRVVQMFCHFAGFDTFRELRDYLELKAKAADAKNRVRGEEEVVIRQGDFVKGIGSVKYLGTILQNGSVAKEFLGSSAGSDSTPLDTDMSKISISPNSVKEAIDSVGAKGYGPIWFVLKNDDRFITTRKAPEEDIEVDTSLPIGKMEVFYTGVVSGGYHYGLRTGFASSEIDYIVIDENDKENSLGKVGVEIVKNGFYIPIVSRESGKVIFSPNDYDMLRSKMAGLSYYDCGSYPIASHEELFGSGVEEVAMQIISEGDSEVRRKRDAINKVVNRILSEIGDGYSLKTAMDFDLSEGSVEMLDTGSTGRGTNVPNDGDFDFMLRLDRALLEDSERMELFRKKIQEAFVPCPSEVLEPGKESKAFFTDKGDFRSKNVVVEGLDVLVDVDLSFTPKTNKVSLSTDMAVSERLNSIREQHPDSYPYVIANIIVAKQVLKEAEAYKPNRGDVPQGGLGGVGVENWILQNGGSFTRAAEDFMRIANQCGDDFEQFKEKYFVWDFGENHMAKGFPHDNFVANNMSSDGYKKMKAALANYLDMTKTNGRSL